MTQRVMRGVGVSPGVAYGPAAIVRLQFPDVPNRFVRPDQVATEIDRLHYAVTTVTSQLQELKNRAHQRAGADAAGIFEAQILMAQDPGVLAAVEELIRKNFLSAETAYEFKALEMRNLWSQARQPVVRDRLADLTSVQLRTISTLLGRELGDGVLSELADRVILVAQEISPGLTVQLNREQVVGLISEEGTRTSHAAILAHSMGIPAVMGVHGALDRIPQGAVVLLDGQTGRITLEPTPDEFAHAQQVAARRARMELKFDAIAGEPAVTPDGFRVTLLGNVDLPEEVDLAVRNGAEGVGLLRTEFLVTGRPAPPTEEEQYSYFRRVSASFPEFPIVIRSYDLGGDKFPTGFDHPLEANPFLGWRSIRVCLDRPEIFRPQLRAILRAARDGMVQLMLPMVTSLEEIRQARHLLHEEAASLRAAGVPSAETVAVGVMVETPAAVMQIDAIAAESDFLSIGSNDLTQYTLAVDRGNARLAHRFQPLHPAVLRSILLIREAALTHGVPLSLCGEMASDPLAVVFLLGLGIDRLSVAPPAIPLVRWVIHKLPHLAASEAARAALAAGSTEEVAAVLRATLAQYPDLLLIDPGASLPQGDVDGSLHPPS